MSGARASTSSTFPLGAGGVGWTVAVPVLRLEERLSSAVSAASFGRGGTRGPRRAGCRGFSFFVLGNPVLGNGTNTCVCSAEPTRVFAPWHVITVLGGARAFSLPVLRPWVSPVDFASPR